MGLSWSRLIGAFDQDRQASQVRHSMGTVVGFPSLKIRPAHLLEQSS